jgi:ADP-ribose pyrophosphatase YjhB (NUDIX family)
MTENPSQPTQTPIRRVRAIVVGAGGRSFLAQVNNRVYPGQLTIMLPGGEPAAGEAPLKALERFLQEQVGITAELKPENTRFILSRTYSYGTPQDHMDDVVDVLFFRIVLDGPPVPFNNDLESVISLSWMSLGDAQRFVADGKNGWQIQAGAMDALEAVLSPEQTREGPDGGQEVARYQAPRDPRNARLPYGGPDQDQTGKVA